MFVNYNMIQYFNSRKSLNGNSIEVYRHIKSFQIYLYLLYFNSGRINKADVKELVSYFNTSKQNILKNLAFLKSEGLIIETKNYYSAIGKDRFTTLSGVQSFMSYLFTEEDLKCSKLFKSKIYKYIGQNIANKYGRKMLDNNIVRTNKTTGQLFMRQTPLTSDVCGDSGHARLNESLSVNIIDSRPEYVYDVTPNKVFQKQSLSYLANLNDRTSRTISRRFKSLTNLSEFDKIKVKASKLTSPMDSLYSSEYSEAVEMRDNFKSRFPILGEGTFVVASESTKFINSTETYFKVVKRSPNVISYFNVDKTQKEVKSYIKNNVKSIVSKVVINDFDDYSDLPY